MAGLSIASPIAWAKLVRISDGLMVAVAVSLPWSTSATGILIVVWLAALLPTMTFAELRRELSTAAGGLPALLWLIAALGMLWAPVSFAERLEGFGGFHKLLVIPLLLLQFRRSGRGMLVLYGFFISCAALLATSWMVYVATWTTMTMIIPDKWPGIPVKDYLAQSAEFFICAFALLAVAFEWLRLRRFALAAAGVALAVVFLANIFYVATGRTALVVIPLLALIFGFRQFGWKGMVGALVAGAVLTGIVWTASPFLRARVLYSFYELDRYRQENVASSTALRLEFWKKSMAFIADAPVIGHGTGSMPELFRGASAGESGAGAVASVNPHNQFFAVAIQLGFVGGAILIAMWVAHLALFRAPGLVPWIGLVIVSQNIVSSLFNSHLFDFFHGWLYVFGVGVLGGMALHGRTDDTS
jgi:O-antigen ligase